MMDGSPGSGNSEGGDPARGQVRGRQGGAVRRNNTGHGIQEQRAVLAQGKIPSVSSPSFLVLPPATTRGGKNWEVSDADADGKGLACVVRRRFWGLAWTRCSAHAVTPVRPSCPVGCPSRVCRARRGSSCPARSFLPKCPSRQVIESVTHPGVWARAQEQGPVGCLGAGRRP